MQQSLPDFLSRVHWHNQQSRLEKMTMMPVASRLSRAVPTISFKNTYKFLRFHHLTYSTAKSKCLANGQGLPFRCSSNSLRNFFTNAIVGMAAASPNGQNVRPSIFSARY